MPIIWPDRYAPERTSVHVSNEIAIDAPPATIWAWLIGAAHWPAWYPNSRDVELEGGAAALSPGARFRWRTFGVRVRSTVCEFVPCERLAWDAAAPLLDGYHAWLIEPRP